MQEQNARNAQRNAWPEPINLKNWPEPIHSNNIDPPLPANAKGGRRSYRQKRRSATKKRKTQRKN